MGDADAIAWEAMTPDERWVEPSPGRLEALTLERLRSGMAVDDARRADVDRPLLVEGTVLSPAVVEEGDPGAPALWLLPAPELLRARAAARGLRDDVSHPERALHLACAVAERHAARVAHEASEAGPSHAVVDVHQHTGRSELLTRATALLEPHLGAWLVRGPHDPAAPLRAANDDVLRQHLGFAGRGWNDHTASTVRPTFHCECPAPECRARVRLDRSAYERERSRGALFAHDL